MKKILITAIAGMLLSSTVALAAGDMQDSHAMPDFSKVDTDQNGLISREEADKYPALKESWTKSDTNEDGNLSASEYQKSQSGKTRSTDRSGY